MNMSYYQVFISAEIRQQGLYILKHLLSKRLAFGGPVFSGPAMFLWKGELVEHDYCFVVTYTREDLKQQLIEEAEKVSVEQVCMISFVPLEASPALLRLLDDTFAERETASSPPKHTDSVAALSFVPSSEIPYRTNKSLDLPKPIAAYFTADKGDSEAISQCFAENAVVKDEGHTYKGRAAIKEWKTSASTKYQYTIKLFACEQKNGKTVVTGRLTGNFPGSPTNLRFFFGVEGDKIASLEIIP
jgi:uncharacterized protein involved in tolerance to divalent cations